jgi:hypothetical protein
VLTTGFWGARRSSRALLPLFSTSIDVVARLMVNTHENSVDGPIWNATFLCETNSNSIAAGTATLRLCACTTQRDTADCHGGTLAPIVLKPRPSSCCHTLGPNTEAQPRFLAYSDRGPSVTDSPSRQTKQFVDIASGHNPDHRPTNRKPCVAGCWSPGRPHSGCKNRCMQCREWKLCFLFHLVIYGAIDGFAVNQVQRCCARLGITVGGA